MDNMSWDVNECSIVIIISLQGQINASSSSEEETHRLRRLHCSTTCLSHSKGSSSSYPSAVEFSASEWSKLQVTFNEDWVVCTSAAENGWMPPAQNRQRWLIAQHPPVASATQWTYWQGKEDVDDRKPGCVDAARMTWLTELVQNTEKEWKWQYAPRVEWEERRSQTTAERFNMTSPDLLHMDYSCLHALSVCRLWRIADARTARYHSQMLH